MRLRRLRPPDLLDYWRLSSKAAASRDCFPNSFLVRCPLRSDERGTVTAEIAIGIPAVLSVVAIAMGVLRWGMDGVAATTIGAETSLAIARGEVPSQALAHARNATPTMTWELEHTDGRICAVAIIPAPLPFVGPQTVRQCATP